MSKLISSFLARSDFVFANNLDPDQDRQNVEFLKVSRRQEKHEQLPSIQSVNPESTLWVLWKIYLCDTNLFALK